MENLLKKLKWFRDECEVHGGDEFVEVYDYAVQLKVELSTMLGLFGDYDFSPTVEQCQKFWNHLMEERQQLKAELKQLKEDCEPFKAQIDQAKTYKANSPSTFASQLDKEKGE